MKPAPTHPRHGGFSLAALAVGLLTGCAFYNAPVVPPQGFLFSNIKAPLTVNVNETPCGPQTRQYSKSSTMYFHDILLTGMNFAWDDAAIAEIARRGGIEHVAFADYEALCVLGVFAKFTVHVYGY